MRTLVGCLSYPNKKGVVHYSMLARAGVVLEAGKPAQEPLCFALFRAERHFICGDEGRVRGINRRLRTSTSFLDIISPIHYKIHGILLVPT